MGALAAGGVATVGQGAGGHGGVASFGGCFDGGVVQVPGGARVAEGGGGPASQHAGLPRRDDQTAAEFVVRVASGPASIVLTSRRWTVRTLSTAWAGMTSSSR